MSKTTNRTLSRLQQSRIEIQVVKSGIDLGHFNKLSEQGLNETLADALLAIDMAYINIEALVQQAQITK